MLAMAMGMLLNSTCHSGIVVVDYLCVHAVYIDVHPVAGLLVTWKLRARLANTSDQLTCSPVAWC